jgi:hypothetical protein
MSSSLLGPGLRPRVPGVLVIQDRAQQGRGQVDTWWPATSCTSKRLFSEPFARGPTLESNVSSGRCARAVRKPTGGIRRPPCGMPVPLRELDRWRRSALRRGFVARRRAVRCWRGGLERTGAAQQDRAGRALGRRRKASSSAHASTEQPRHPLALHCPCTREGSLVDDVHPRYSHGWPSADPGHAAP